MNPLHSVSRRQFCGYTAGALGLAAGGKGLSRVLADDPKPNSATKQSPAGEKTDMPIVDTHQHLWDLEKLRLPWLKDEPSINKNFVTSDFVEATKGLGVVKAIYMEVAVDDADLNLEVDYVTNLCNDKTNPTVAAVIGGRPASKDFAKYLTRHKYNPYIRGIRQVLHVPETPQGFCLQEEFVQGIQLLGKVGLTFDLCMRSQEIGDALKLVNACPDTRFILDHCGNAGVHDADLTQWKKDMEAIAGCERVIGKISGVIASGKGGTWSIENLSPIINHTWDVFGPDRVVFGGDWPVCTLGATYAQWVKALKEIASSRSTEHQRKLFSENAIKHYKIEA